MPCLVIFVLFSGGNCFSAYQDHLPNETFYSRSSNLILSLDTLKLYRIDNDTRTPIPLIKKGIAWWTDKNVKFRNPTGDGNNLTALFQGKKRKKRNFKNARMLQTPFDFSLDFKHILIAEFCVTDILLNVLNKCSLKKSKLGTALLFERSLSSKSCRFLVKVFGFYLYYNH